VTDRDNREFARLVVLGAFDGIYDDEDELTARRHQRFTAELERELGEPVLVTDHDGITRRTWHMEVPYDELERICAASNARMGHDVDDSEGGASD
jgi:hypothetical protein